MAGFKLTPGKAAGEALFLFAGFTRKRDADQAQRQAADHVIADALEMAYLTDELKRRRGWMTFTLCECVVHCTTRTFHCSTHAGLARLEQRRLDEHLPFAFAKRLRDRCKYWVCCVLEYADVGDEFAVVNVLGIRGRATCYVDANPPTPECDDKVDDFDPLGVEAAFDASVHCAPAKKKLLPDDEDPIGPRCSL